MLPAVDLTKYRHTETVAVAASPEAVYALVSDITRMGEWSPVCTGGSWTDDARTTFVGTNDSGVLQWETHCRVEVAEPAREFTFVMAGFTGETDLARWSYTIAPTADGCELSEHWSVLPAYPGFIGPLIGDRPVEDYLDETLGRTRAGMAETLARMKAVAEA
jgi:carbon monoxide dehydrogenase subunit G